MNAMYSKFVDDKNTQFCFLFQVIEVPPNEKMYPLVDFLEFAFSPESTLMNLVKARPIPLLWNNPMLMVPLRYQRFDLVVFRCGS